MVWLRHALSLGARVSSRAAQLAAVAKNLPAMREMRVRSLGGEDPLEEERQPTECSCLENPTDRGAWRAAVHGVAKSRTRLSNTEGEGKQQEPSVA